MSAEAAGMDPLTSDDPTKVGPYQLLGRLGAGGMGQVYLGRAPDGNLVAVKLVYPHLARTPEFRRRFRQEVLAARQVSGAHTAAITDADTDAAVPWLATSYVAGPSLAEFVAQRGPLAPDAVRALAGGLAEALASVHAAGVIHRDVKPANVLLAADGPRLIDFGIARALDATSITQTGMTAGTPGYVGPERLLGGPVGEPADIYALGAVLYFALTGGPPFGTGEAAQLYYRTVHEEPDMSAVTDPVLHRLITDCLTKEPAARPSTADVLRRLADPTAPHDATMPADATVPHQAWPPVPVRPSPVPARETRRRRRIAVLAVASAVVLVAGVVLALTLHGSGTPSAGAVAPPKESGFPWSLTRGQGGGLVGLWSAGDSVVVGTALHGLAAYDAATGRARWTWQLPRNDGLCDMSPTQSDGIGAFDYGAYDTDGAVHCDHLQTISVSTGKLNWAKAISLVGAGAPGFPTQAGGTALPIDGDVVSAPFAGSADPRPGAGVSDNDILSAFVQGGTVGWSTNLGSHPMPNGCLLSGTARVLHGSYYTVGVCGGQDQVVEMDGGPTPVAPLPGCRPITNGFVTGFLATDTDFLVIGCDIDGPGAKLYTLRAGSTTAVPVDLSGVDASIIGYQYGGEQQPKNMVLANGIMYLVAGQNEVNGGQNNGVVAVDMATGKQVWAATLPGITTSVRLLAGIDGGVTVVAHGGSGTPAMYTVRASGGAVHRDYNLNSGEAAVFHHADGEPDTPYAVAAGDTVAVGFHDTLNSGDVVLGAMPN